MDKSWMRAARSSAEYSEGTINFIQFAFRESAKNSRILCPCKICVNSRWLGEHEVYDHLICDGFMSGYTTWIHHGESMRPSEATTGPSSQFEEYGDSDEMDEMLLEGFGMYDTRTLGEEQESEDDFDDDAEAYYRLVNDGHQELYPGCKRFSKKAKATDGQPLADCVEVLVNVVLKETTELPRAQGKINKIGNAQARCIPWPRKNIMQTGRTTVLHSKVSSVCSQMSFNNSENVDPNETTTGTQVTNHQTNCSTSEGAVRNILKRKKVSETIRMKKVLRTVFALVDAIRKSKLKVTHS
ncbi:uncharacterized protein LOC119320692 [Triticum dicoccoides]|uniref:uncharacterized protein LOC119320692 n=1 Tax=Triticum dicoccoides TaxID=85692 RepID=UPI001891D1E5|nr:uncharacterized protein LOC119320692 [Triticum dicoccoides]